MGHPVYCHLWYLISNLNSDSVIKRVNLENRESDREFKTTWIWWKVWSYGRRRYLFILFMYFLIWFLRSTDCFLNSYRDTVQRRLAALCLSVHSCTCVGLQLVKLISHTLTLTAALWWQSAWRPLPTHRGRPAARRRTSRTGCYPLWKYYDCNTSYTLPLPEERRKTTYLSLKLILQSPIKMKGTTLNMHEHYIICRILEVEIICL